MMSSRLKNALVNQGHCLHSNSSRRAGRRSVQAQKPFAGFPDDRCSPAIPSTRPGLELPAKPDRSEQWTAKPTGM